MPKKMKDNQWYDVYVDIPAGTDPNDVQDILDDMAKKLSNSEHDMKVRKTKNGQGGAAAAAAPAAGGLTPLYVCHGKF